MNINHNSQIDTTFYNWMFEPGNDDRISSGYWGSNVLSMFQSSSTQRGAGRRRRRFVEGGTGVEVEFTFRADTLADSEIEDIIDTGSVTEMLGASKLSAAVCEESALDYDKTYFQLEVRILKLKNVSHKVSRPLAPVPWLWGRRLTSGV